MNVLTFLLILFLIWLIFGRQIKAWFVSFMARRTEDYIRKAAGLPPRPGSREDRRRRRRQKGADSSHDESFTFYRSPHRENHRDPNEPLIPKEYAEDVEFVETISYSQATTIGVKESTGTRTFYHESQVSDVEWEEIKIKKKR